MNNQVQFNTNIIYIVLITTQMSIASGFFSASCQTDLFISQIKELYKQLRDLRVQYKGLSSVPTSIESLKNDNLVLKRDIMAALNNWNLNQSEENIGKQNKQLNELREKENYTKTQLEANNKQITLQSNDIKRLTDQVLDLKNKSNLNAALIRDLKAQLLTYSKCSQAKSCLTSDSQVPPLNDGLIQGSGWTVIQRRSDGSVNYDRNFNDYKKGFGNLNGEFFLGLEKLYRITKNSTQELYIQLEDFNGEKRYARYSKFEIGNADEDYALQSLGEYSGTAGDSLNDNLLQKFSTYDHDRDSDDVDNCAQKLGGGWWYASCGLSNLNGKYLEADLNYDSLSSGIFWNDWLGWEYSLKSVQIMIRPTNP